MSEMQAEKETKMMVKNPEGFKGVTVVIGEEGITQSKFDIHADGVLVISIKPTEDGGHKMEAVTEGTFNITDLVNAAYAATYSLGGAIIDLCDGDKDKAIDILADMYHEQGEALKSLFLKR